MFKPNWVKGLKNGAPRIFGFLSADIKDSRKLSGANYAIQNTKSNLDNVLSGISNKRHFFKMPWKGDGGSFILLIDTPKDYNPLVQCALDFHNAIPNFNKDKTHGNQTDSSILMRISCHKGETNFHHNPSHCHGVELDHFLGDEKGIGEAGYVVITENVYRELTSRDLKEKFTLWDKTWRRISATPQSQEIKLYIFPQLPKPIEKMREVDVVMIVAEYFKKIGATVKFEANINGFRADLIVETNEYKAIVECKSSIALINETVVEQLDRIVRSAGFSKGIIVTTSGFTEQAKQSAIKKNIDLRTIEDLQKEIKQIELDKAKQDFKKAKVATEIPLPRIRKFNVSSKKLLALIYMLKPYKLSDSETRNKVIKLVNISMEKETELIQSMKESKIIKQTGDTIWISNDRLGEQLMREVLFDKTPLIDFREVEKMFYGK